MLRWTILAAAIALATPLRAAPAQQDVARADAWLRAGRIDLAEALYYRAARREPRNPEARFALGTYLASRGALRVGAVLIEEARRFGGDSARAATLLAPLYARLGDFGAVARLEPARLGPGALARARWLQGNPPTTGGPDSVVVPLLQTTNPAALGAIRVVIAGDTVRAEVDPSVSGFLLDRSHARTPGVRAFDAAGSATQPGVAVRAALGAYTLRNMPVTLAELGGPGRAKVGLDWLAPWAPTMDPGLTRTVTLRRSGRAPAGIAARAARRVPLLLSYHGANGQALSGSWIAVPGRLVRIDAVEAAALRTGRVTLDPRRGELWFDR